MLQKSRDERSRMKADRPRVTVIIPTYNWATVLPWAIGSVMAQTMTEWELWVIGDGCTDESESVVATVDDSRVRWHNLAENGRSQAGPNNEGLRRAQAEYVAYLGHDDLWLPTHLDVMIRSLDAGARMAYGRQIRIDPGCAPYLWPPEYWTYALGDWIPPTSMLHRLDDVIDVGGWRFPDQCEKLDPESDLWSRISTQFTGPVLVDQVTSVKLPASLRKDVYQDRPCDEQASWWARIGGAGSTEEFLTSVMHDPSMGAPDRYDESDIPPQFIGLEAPSAADRQRLNRRYKGLDA